MKKLLSYFLIFAILWANLSYADIVSEPDYWANLTSFEDSFNQELTVWANQKVNFKVSTLINNDSKTLVVNLPAWFSYTWNYSSWSTNCDNFNVINTLSTSLKYSFWATWYCVWEIYFSYNTNSDITSWTKNINIMDWTNLIWSIKINVVNENILNSVKSYDLNQNWYIETFRLEFLNDITWTFDNNLLTIWWKTPTLSWSISWKTAYLKIDDNQLNTQTSYALKDEDWWMFNNVWIIDNLNINDKAWSVLDKVNWIDVNNNTTKKYINVWTWVTFDFLERFFPWSQNYFSIENSNNSLSWTFSFDSSNKSLYFSPYSSQITWNYNLKSLSQAKDWSWNSPILKENNYVLYVAWTRNINCDWLPTNANWTTSSNITQTWNWIDYLPSNTATHTTSSVSNVCKFECNSWYNWNWSECKKSSTSSSWWGGWGWWGWWGWAISYQNCSLQQLQCVDWTLIKIDWISCEWWYLWRKCIVSDNISNNLKYSKTFEDYLKNNWWIITKEVAKNYLLSLNNKSLNKLITNYADKIVVSKPDFFSNIDNNFKNNYLDLLISYINLFENINNYLKTKDNNYVQIAKNNYLSYSSLLPNTITPEYKYVKVISYNWINLNLPIDENLAISITKIQKVILNKLLKLKNSQTINNDEFYIAVNHYNDFVLYFTIWKKTNLELVKQNAIDSLTNVLKTYKKKVITKTVSPVVVSNIKTIKDVYNFSKDLKIWDYNNDVRNLQNVLKSYWYFDFEISWYFWEWTNNSLKKFTNEVLNTEYNNYFNSNLREKVNNLEFKQ